MTKKTKVISWNENNFSYSSPHCVKIWYHSALNATNAPLDSLWCQRFSMDVGYLAEKWEGRGMLQNNQGRKMWKDVVKRWHQGRQVGHCGILGFNASCLLLDQQHFWSSKIFSGVSNETASENISETLSHFISSLVLIQFYQRRWHFIVTCYTVKSASKKCWLSLNIHYNYLLCPVPGPPVQEGHKTTWNSPVQSHQDD